MKVYILHVTKDETGHTDLVFSSMEKAKAYIDSFGPKYTASGDWEERWERYHARFCDGVSIIERTVDEE